MLCCDLCKVYLQYMGFILVDTQYENFEFSVMAFFNTLEQISFNLCVCSYLLGILRLKNTLNALVKCFSHFHPLNLYNRIGPNNLIVSQRLHRVEFRRIFKSVGLPITIEDLVLLPKVILVVFDPVKVFLGSVCQNKYGIFIYP